MGMGPQFTVRNTQHVFKFDALENSHPMSVPVNKRNEVNELFDDIPYFKGIAGISLTVCVNQLFLVSFSAGPAVIRMLASFLGQPTFRAGLTEYLNQKCADSSRLSRFSLFRWLNDLFAGSTRMLCAMICGMLWAIDQRWMAPIYRPI